MWKRIKKIIENIKSHFNPDDFDWEFGEHCIGWIANAIVVIGAIDCFCECIRLINEYLL